MKNYISFRSGSHADHEEGERRLTTHEAGHLVAGYALRWKLKEVTFAPDADGISGHACIEEPLYLPGQSAQEQITVALAGLAAEEALLGGFTKSRAMSDLTAARRSAKAYLRERRSDTQSDLSERKSGAAHFFPNATTVDGALSAGFLAAYRLIQIWRPAVSSLSQVFVDGFHEGGDAWEELRFEAPVLEQVIRSAMSATPKGRKALRSIRKSKGDE